MSSGPEAEAAPGAGDEPGARGSLREPGEPGEAVEPGEPVAYAEGEPGEPGAAGEPGLGEPGANGANGEAGEPGLDGPDALVAKLEAERDEYLDALRRLQADFENYRKRMIRQQTEQLERAAQDLVVKLLPVLDALEAARAHLGDQEAATAEGKALVQAAALLDAVLAKEGLERIDEVGVAFDPSAHDAVEHEVPDAPETAEAPEPPADADVSGAPPEPPADAGVSGGKPSPGADTAGSPGVAGPEAQAGSPGGAQPEAVVSGVLRAGYRWKGRVARPAMVKVRG